MLDKEVKDILQEQFSKDRNYQKVLNSVNKKSISYNKILKIALLPACSAIIAAIIIPKMNNKPSEYNPSIAKTNTTENIIITEQVNNNTIAETAKDDEIVKEHEIEETPKVEIQTGKNTENKDNPTSTDKKYYRIEENTSEASWAVNPTDLEKVINLHDKIKMSIVRIRVTEVKDAIFLPKMKNYYDPWHPKTPVKVELLETFEGGKNINSENIYFKNDTIYTGGGDILLANLEKQLDKDEVDKMGITNLTDEIKNSEYMRFWNEYFYTPQIGKEYILFVSPMDDGIYGIVDAGYGIFTSRIENHEEIITNVISNKEYKLKEVLEY